MPAPRNRQEREDREAESWVRQNTEFRLPDIRRGRGDPQRVFRVSPLPKDRHEDYCDNGDDESAALSPLDEHAAVTRKVKLVDPAVGNWLRMPVLQKNGKIVRTPVALTLEQYLKREAELAEPPVRPSPPPRQRAQRKRNQHPILDALDLYISPYDGQTYLTGRLPQKNPVEPPEVCSHCGDRPAATKKHGWCRACQDYWNSHKRTLPPPKILNSRRYKDGIE